MVINSSINFLIYCAGSQQFKDEFFDMFVPKYLEGLRRRLVPSEQQQREAELVNDRTIVTRVEANTHHNGHQGQVSVVVHQKHQGVTQEIV